MDRPDTRMCWTCRQEKPWADFPVDRSKPSGHRSYCKACDSARVLAAYHARHPKVERHCVECGELLEGKQRVVCSSTCRERRWRRLHPEAARRKQQEKRARRRARATAEPE